MVAASDKQTGEKRRVGDGTPGPGRKKGVPNKRTQAVKEALELAFEGIGGVPALQTWATTNETEFYKLWVRMLPTDVKAEVVGAIGVTLDLSHLTADQKRTLASIKLASDT